MSRKLILIFLTAFFIRLISINQSLWLDEAVTAKVVSQLSLFQIPSFFSPSDFHPPLYYLFMRIWSSICGYSEIALRLPSIIFSLSTGYTIYLIGKKAIGEKFGLLCLALYLYNPLVIYYSQEARMYGLVTFFLTCSFYFALQILSDTRGKKQRVSHHSNLIDKKALSIQNYSLYLFIIFSILSFYTFYGSIFIIIPMLGMLVWRRKYTQFFVLSVIFLISILVISPLIYRQYINSKLSLNLVKNWSLVLGTVTLKNLLLIPIKFSIGRISFYPKWLYWGISISWSVFIIIFIVKGLFKKTIWGVLLVSPLLFGMIFSFISPLMQYFRFLYLIPIYCLLMGLGIWGFSSKRLIGAIVIVGFLLFSFLYLLIPQFHREDWKTLALSIPKNKEVYMILPSSDPLLYYNSSLKLKELRLIKDAHLNQQEIIIIPYVAEVYGFDYQSVLKGKKCFLGKKESFRELILEKWICDDSPLLKEASGSSSMR